MAYELGALQRVNPNSPMDFVKGLKKVIKGVDDIVRPIEHIQFLKTIDGEVTSQPQKWANALLSTIEGIEQLTAPQKIDDGSTLYLSGPVVGSSEIQEELERNKDRHVCVYAWSHYFSR